MPSWHAKAQLHLSHTKFSHKYFSTVHTTGHVSGVTVVTHNCRICVFFLFHFNATIMVAYSLLQACVVLTVWHMPNTSQMEFYLLNASGETILFPYATFFSHHWICIQTKMIGEVRWLLCSKLQLWKPQRCNQFCFYGTNTHFYLHLLCSYNKQQCCYVAVL